MSDAPETDAAPTCTISVCMGSACHQLGVYDLLPALDALLEKHGLKAKVELEGAFCLGPCRHGIVMQIGETQLLELNAKNIEERFERDILPLIAKNEAE